jgi:hypothetical protein
MKRRYAAYAHIVSKVTRDGAAWKVFIAAATMGAARAVSELRAIFAAALVIIVAGFSDFLARRSGGGCRGRGSRVAGIAYYANRLVRDGAAANLTATAVVGARTTWSRDAYVQPGQGTAELILRAARDALTELTVQAAPALG